MSKKRKNQPQSAQNKPNTGNRQRAAAKEPEAAANMPEAAIDTERHKRELYVREMSGAVSGISDALNRLMTETYFNVFWECEEQKEPGKLGAFFLPLLKKNIIADRTPKNIILDRGRFLDVCGFDTRDRAGKKAREFKENRLPVTGKDYQAIPDKDFDALIQEEFEKSYTDGKRVRSYFDSLDLQACCKINIQYASGRFHDVYMKLREAGLLGGTSENGWSELCQAANDARNTYGGHISPNTIRELRDKGGPKTELRAWFEVAELLHSEKYNPTSYGQLRSAWDKAIELHESIRKSKLFLFRELLGDLQERGLAGLAESDLRSAAQLRDIKYDDCCALFNGTREELARLLEQDVIARTKIPLKDLEEHFGDDIMAVGDIEAYMESLGVRVLDGTVLGRSREEVMTLLSKRRERMALEEKYRQLLRQLEEARTDRRPEEDAGESRNHLPMLRELARYQGGPLSPAQLSELLMTHQLVLDASVLLSEAGRAFLSRVLVDRLERLRGRGQEVFMVMDATTRYHMFDECERCKEAELVYRGTDWTRKPESERREQARRIEAMRPAKAAYYFTQDVLRGKGLLRYIGLPDPSREGREMLRMLLEENPSRRFCVLTCGTGPLAEDIDREHFPLCAVARIQGDYYSARGNQPGPNCLIFPRYLPLAGGSVPVDFDRDLRERLRLAGETYTAGAFAGGKPPKDGDRAQEASE